MSFAGRWMEVETTFSRQTRQIRKINTIRFLSYAKCRFTKEHIEGGLF
jgi:hypothetical protein